MRKLLVSLVLALGLAIPTVAVTTQAPASAASSSCAWWDAPCFWRYWTCGPWSYNPWTTQVCDRCGCLY